MNSNEVILFKVRLNGYDKVDINVIILIGKQNQSENMFKSLLEFNENLKENIV